MFVALEVFFPSWTTCHLFDLEEKKTTTTLLCWCHLALNRHRWLRSQWSLVCLETTRKFQGQEEPKQLFSYVQESDRVGQALPGRFYHALHKAEPCTRAECICICPSWVWLFPMAPLKWSQFPYRNNPVFDPLYRPIATGLYRENPYIQIWNPSFFKQQNDRIDLCN